MQQTNLKGLSLRELEEFALSLGEKPYRGRQLFDWMYNKQVSDFGAMTSMSADLRERLRAGASIDSIGLVDEKRSAADGTVKFLFELADGNRIESVLIPPKTAFRRPGSDDPAGEDDEELTAGAGGEGEPGQQGLKRHTLCVSTQVGCALDCIFCATASMGFTRNLTAGEIVDQVLAVRRISGEKISNVVYMGMGEPLLNYDGVMKSVDIISSGMKIAARRITVSTAGWVPGIRRMAEEGRRVKLAVSLHSLDPEARAQLMPVTKKYPLVELLEATREFTRRTGQRVTFEYILFDGWNDRDRDLKALTSLAGSLPCKVNIIPFHDIAFTLPGAVTRGLRPSPASRIDEFARRLREKNVTVFVRSSAGEDINAACGQLAVSHPDRPARKAAGTRSHAKV
jgi:23S rRNA (adenine2503-C2)-methyltransferase